jgi:hypothetical protein
MIGDRASDIRVFAAADVPAPALNFDKLKEKPTLVFCPSPIRHFRPPRGTIRCGAQIPKFAQMKLLRQAHVRIPKSDLVMPNTRLDEREWGSHVILKPTAVGASLGVGVELWRTSKVHFRPPAAFPKSHPGRYAPMMVQKFISTGDYSSDYRVVTLFGNPLIAYKKTHLQSMPDIHAPDFEYTFEAIASAPMMGKGRELIYDKDVLDFAASVFKAVPQVPLQACDIRRDINSGKLYCLEFNPGGNTWHFSSMWGKKYQSETGMRFEDQFKAFDVMADVFIRQTRRLAS